MECGVFNACYTRLLALALRERGVLHAIGWCGKVRDPTAAKFALQFFKHLAGSPTDYKGSFEAGRLEVRRSDPPDTFNVESKSALEDDADDDVDAGALAFDADDDDVVEGVFFYQILFR